MRNLSRKFIHFYPQQNFLKNFPIEGRAVSLEHMSPSARKLADRLAYHFKMPVLTSDPRRDRSAFRIVMLGKEDKSVLPEQLSILTPTSFVALVPDSRCPQVLIGGYGEAGFNDTVLFLNKIFPLIFENTICAGDFHIHTKVSADGFTKPEDMPASLINANLDVCAITDHNSTEGARLVKKAAAGMLPIITGQELTGDEEQNHVIILGIENNIPPGTSRSQVLKLGQKPGVFICQAHATDRFYFKCRGKKAVSNEAFNFLSGVPSVARDYLSKCLKENVAVAALGNSDSHLFADVGKARTYMLLPSLNEASVIAALKSGKTVAFQRGNFLGVEPLATMLKHIYYHSDLLDGKLVPIDDRIYFRPLPAVQKNGNRHSAIKVLKPCDPGPKVFCSFERCSCKETFFDLRSCKKPFQLTLGKKEVLLLEMNGIRRWERIHPGLDLDMRPRIRNNGLNEINIYAGMSEKTNLRLLVGKELKIWEIRGEKECQYQRVAPASNLQVLGLAPKNFQGTFYYRAFISAGKSAYKNPSLLFDGVDGEIDIRVDGQTVLSRGMYHWEDSIEIPLNGWKGKRMAVEIVLNNTVGLCGIHNKAYIVDNIPLSGKKVSYEISGNPDLALLRCGETRVRCLFLDKNFKVRDQMLLNGDKVTIKDPEICWLALNSMNALAQLERISIEYNSK